MHVYAVGIENGLVKIGLANDPAKRLDSLQTGCPDRLHLLAAKRFKTRAEAEAEEKRIHAECSHKRRRGEWFDLSPAEVAQFFGDVAPPAHSQARRRWYERSLPNLPERTRAKLRDLHKVEDDAGLLEKLAA